MNDTLLIILLAGLAFLTMLVYRLGRRRITVLAERWSKALEGALDPVETEYINIGGLVGYHANYTLDDPAVKEVKVTFTLLPRHSLFFYPLSKLFIRQDRMFLTFFLKKKFKGEAHLLERRLAKFPTHRVKERPGMERRSLQDKGREYLVYATDQKAEKVLTDLLHSLPEGVPRHLTLYPDNNTLYAFIRPGKGDLEKVVGQLREAVKSRMNF